MSALLFCYPTGVTGWHRAPSLSVITVPSKYKQMTEKCFSALISMCWSLWKEVLISRGELRRFPIKWLRWFSSGFSQ